MYGTLSLVDFLGQLAARTPTPGGGCASALAGAVGAAQAAMCAAFTTGSPKLKMVEHQASQLHLQFQTMWHELVDLMDKDSQAYQQLMSARKAAKHKGQGTDSRLHAAAIGVSPLPLASALEAACQVPEQMVVVAHRALGLIRDFAPICNPRLRTDLWVAACLLEAAAQGAGAQVLLNLSELPNSAARAARCRAQLDECLKLKEDIRPIVFKT